MDKLNWAEHEIELALKGIDPEDEYTRACYDSALRALKSIPEDGHGGFGIISNTLAILSRLAQWSPLTPIIDTPDIWEACEFARNEGCLTFQCRRRNSLFKDVYPDGTVRYTDMRRISCYHIGNPGVLFWNGFVNRRVDETLPITMPYCPADRSMRVGIEALCAGPANGDAVFSRFSKFPKVERYANTGKLLWRHYDTMGIFHMTDQDGAKYPINRYFTVVGSEDGTIREITAEAYAALKARSAQQGTTHGGN